MSQFESVTLAIVVALGIAWFYALLTCFDERRLHPLIRKTLKGDK